MLRTLAARAQETMPASSGLAGWQVLRFLKGGDMADRVFNVLFLCTGNSARSILAEALLNKDGKRRFKASSAGSHPTGKVNPFAIELLRQHGFPVDGLRSKGWDEYTGPGAPKLDFVFTVCDNAAGEACPIWPGKPVTAHWGIEDPAAVGGTDAHKRQAFSDAFILLSRRISLFTSLSLEKLEGMALQRELQDIGHLRDKGK